MNSWFCRAWQQLQDALLCFYFLLSVSGKAGHFVRRYYKLKRGPKVACTYFPNVRSDRRENFIDTSVSVALFIGSLEMSIFFYKGSKPGQGLQRPSRNLYTISKRFFPISIIGSYSSCVDVSIQKVTWRISLVRPNETDHTIGLYDVSHLRFTFA